MSADADLFQSLRRLTAARIGLGRAGCSLPTARVLEFQMAHAAARDAVHAPFDAAGVCRALVDLSPVAVESRAVDRAAYLQRPDAGRSLDEASRARLVGSHECVLALADGLSAVAAERHGPALARAIFDATPGWDWAAPVVARFARVALGDDIAAAFGARLVVMLIGERPGLSSPDSLGAYLTVAPQPGVTTDAARNCVSNIRPEGLPVADAARKIVALAALARQRGISGVSLKEDEALALAAPIVS